MRICLAPGASGNQRWLAPWLRDLAALGHEPRAITLPRGRAENAVGAYRRAVTDPATAIIGGQSFGGRVATLLAAEQTLAGIVCLSYPLHPPGRLEEWDRRTAHWPAIDCPVLLLSGESDPFARIDLLRNAMSRLPQPTLVTFPRRGHGLAAERETAVSRIAEWIETAVRPRLETA